MAKDPSTTCPGPARDTAFDEIVQEIVSKMHAGEPVDIERYARQFPAQADRLEELLVALKAVVACDRSAARRSSGPAAPSDIDPTAHNLGDFRILRQLGRGGMGVVYEAEEATLKRQVALKVLPFAALMEPRQLERFKREARLAAALDHPSIVKVYSLSADRGVHFYAMEYVDGQNMAQLIEELRNLPGSAARPADENLRSRLARDLTSGRFAPPEVQPDATPSKAPSAANTVDNALPQAETQPGLGAGLSGGSVSSREFFRSVAHLGAQAADALEHAHQMGVVHRDVKPSNLLLDARGHLWITDFGLATTGQQTGLTISGELAGTLAYMSPEQLEPNGNDLDRRTDVYSLGVTLYELLTLQPAFGRSNPHELVQAILRQEPTPPRQLNPAISKDLETVVLKAMARRPQSRYATAADLAGDLCRFVAGQPVRARRPSRAAKLVHRLRQHQAVALTAFLAVLIVILGVVGTRTLFTRTQSTAEHWGTDEIRSALERLESQERGRESQERGRGYVEAGQYDKAIAELTETIRLNPHAAGAYLWRGRAYSSLGKSAEAMADYNEAIRLNPANSKAYEWRGTAYRDLGRNDLAIAHYTEAIRLDPRNVWAYHWRGEVYLDLGRDDEALADLTEALRLNPDFQMAYNRRANAYVSMGQYDNAVDDFTQAIRVDPGNSWAYLERGGVYLDLGRHDEALADLTKAIQLNPDFVQAYNRCANAYTSIGQYDKAIDTYGQLIRRHPNRPVGYNNRGNVFSDMGDLDKALADYNEAIRLDPNRPVGYNNRGIVFSDMGELDKALADYNEAIRLDPNYSLAYVNRGYMFKRKGELDKAFADCNKAIRLDPNLPEAYSMRGLVFQAKGELDKALADYNEAIRLNPNNAAQKNSLAWLLATCPNVEFRDPQQALKLAEEAVKLSPENGSYWNTLGVA